ncbi:hypothetical protein RCL_jg1431.t1 [Rhizophagus clarus]|uniref:Uncharacterized protein n=1 Tax=Rhizophagus clarus TaxID=94130 RepID=A0A8H3LMC1_9GLOM|nr:hypothetical protein RCL_jg1431.t1 [Rhizophagus clarus]
MSSTSESAITHEINLDNSSHNQHQSNPVVLLNLIKSKSKDKGKKKNKTKNIFIVNPAFVNNWDDLLAQDVSSFSLLIFLPENKITGKTITSFTFMSEFSNKEKK